MTEATTTIKVRDLKPLEDLYPRREASAAHARSLLDALRAGAEFPPLIVEEGTNFIVDGYHRWSAYKDACGPDHPVRCILRSYASPVELFEDAVRENTRHGLRFSDADKGRCVHLAAKLKLKASDLAPVLRLTQTRMAVLRAEYLEVAGPKRRAEPTQRRPAEARPLKRSSGPKNPALWRATAHAQGLSLLLESEVLDGGYSTLARPLAALRSALGEYLGRE